MCLTSSNTSTISTKVCSCSMIVRLCCWTADGKQLVCEVVSLGNYSIFLDLKILGHQGAARVAHYRSHGESQVTNFEEVVKLTGYRFYRGQSKGSLKLSTRRCWPQARWRPRMAVINRLSSDDIYLQTRTFPDPQHRSTALANQLQCCTSSYTLHHEHWLKNKHKCGKLSTATSTTTGLLRCIWEWPSIFLWSGQDIMRPSRLLKTLDIENVRHAHDVNARALVKCEKDLAKYLTEGKVDRGVCFGPHNSSDELPASV